MKEQKIKWNPHYVYIEVNSIYIEMRTGEEGRKKCNNLLCWGVEV